MPNKIIKNNSDILSKFFQANLNNTIETSTFHETFFQEKNSLKKKNSRNDKRNYRPINILPNVSKIYERCLYNKLEEYVRALLFKYPFSERL